ncbi:ABC-2 family transporter [Kribbella orskensis]|uniref:ABC-2 family transporter n=1 Tax=Kribbella orskensis TaxID=2512216 RepID=A0ABY2BAH4_9ACTN|nr:MULTISPECIES: ABC transporter permease [Kribbella]TCN31128.1 ABC-2 family transporter [Kribbella sp. VKM Ac-2500]TCO11634.1 ABC-2 family transporter [Kribbella orskensis]
MTNLVRAEFTKLFTTKLWLWLLVGAAGLTALFVSLTIGLEGREDNPSPPLSSAEGQQALFSSAGGAAVFTVVLGIIAMTGEYRYQTITPTFLVTPRRGRVVVAKLIAYALVGLAFGTVNVLVSLAIAVPWLDAKNVDLSLTANRIPQTLLGVLLGLAIFTVIGVAIGALVRHQVAAVVGTLVYSLVVESFVSLLPTIRDYFKYFPGGAFSGLTNSYEPDVTFLAAWQAGLLMVAYGVVFAVLGITLAIRRDIT